MTASYRLVLRVDATPVTGLGHAVRVAGIVEELPKPIHIIVVGRGAALRALFPNAEHHEVPDDTTPLVDLARAHKAAGVLVDLPSHEGRVWTDPQDGGPYVIVINDYGGPIKADLIVNGTVLDEYHQYPLMTDTRRLLLGPRYTMIRMAFGRTPWREDRTSGVVIVAGSGTRAAEWTTLLTGAAVNRTSWGAITVVVGATFADIVGLQRKCDQIGVVLKVGLSGEELASTLADARVALITGGMIVYEALAVGVPAVVFPQLPDMPPEVTWLAARGCILDLGYDGGMNPAAVSAAVTRLLSDPALAKDMSARSRRLIDGRGIARAAEAIATLLRVPAAPRTA
jgi:spore coat polysaccharide biosynthesis predicted glycosyltransferase SpsG